MMNPTFFLPAAINHLLASEPWPQSRLVAHAGKLVRVDTGVAKLSFRVAPDGTLLSADADEPATVTIRMRLTDLPLMAQNRERAFSYVQIEGDAEFAAAIAQVAQSVGWEAEEDLSKLVGDIAARRLVQAGKGVMDAAHNAHRKITENLAEYFLEENPLLVRPVVISAFTKDVVKLRDDVERLGKRIDKLLNKSAREAK